ncbi:hypothetical protein AGMMS49574_05330 [Bacteroidia bacterium]|nr:hypothetical protein AGMMS49574_05330 [Bacteroidia bacterium]
MNDEFYSNVQSFYGLTNLFGFTELEISMAAGDDVYIDGWLGAALRNNLLFAADNVNVVGAISLRQAIDLLTIRQDHPLYNEMKGGFPKGFGLSLSTHQDSTFSCQLKKGEIIRFSIQLYGHFSNYLIPFSQAVQGMCTRGIGKPQTPFYLISITENPIVCLSDFTNNIGKADKQTITIQYTVPTNLYNDYKNKNNYHDRQHEFPGFYQLVRTLAYRIAKLTALYTHPDTTTFYPEIESTIATFTQPAVTPILTSAQLRRIELNSTAKKGLIDRIQFSGYTGELTFTGHFTNHLPLLLFMQNIGAGSNTTYGLGRYKIIKQ